MKVFLSHIFCNTKVVVVAMLNFLFEVGMKFVFIVAALLLAFAFSDGKLPIAKICCLKGKTRNRYVCHGRMISLNAEMARVKNVERGNFVCEHHWHMLRTRNNICLRPLPSHSRAMSPSKAISSLRQSGEKHAFVLTRNAVVHQLPKR